MVRPTVQIVREYVPPGTAGLVLYGKWVIDVVRINPSLWMLYYVREGDGVWCEEEKCNVPTLTKSSSSLHIMTYAVSLLAYVAVVY
jgi:hypothetical protein